MRWLPLALMLAVPTTALADVLVVNIWDPFPGKSQETVQAGLEAKAIHEKLGAQVSVALDDMGNMHYAVSFESWEAWGKWVGQVQASQEWQTWWSRRLADPPAELKKVYRITDVPTPE